MELGLRGKVAIVGGGSRGLGRACAVGLANEGTRVAICSRNPEALQQAAREISQETGSEVLPIAGDLSSYDDIKSLVAQTVDHFGGLDILVNNSGGPPAASA